MRIESVNKSWLLAVAVITPGCGKLNCNYLDNTYFPLGSGYQWIYLRQNFTTIDETESISFDTVAIKVSSTEISNGWSTFQLEGGAFEDVGEKIVVCKDGILVFGGTDTIPLIPPDDFKPKESVIGYCLGYRDSLLTISLYSGGGQVLMVHSTERLKGIGVISQMAELRSPPHYEGYIDRLMYFIKDQDTIWHSEDQD